MATYWTHLVKVNTSLNPFSQWVSLISCIAIVTCFSCTPDPTPQARNFFSYIPAETSYLAHLNVDTSSETVKSWAQTLKGVDQVYRPDLKERHGLTYLAALLSDLSSHIEASSTEKIGIPKRFGAALYSHWLWPVYMQEVHDQALFVQWMNHVAKLSSEASPLQWVTQTHGAHTIYVLDLKRDALSVMMYFSPDRTVKISVAPRREEDTMRALLTGDQKTGRYLTDTGYVKRLAERAEIQEDSTLVWVSFNRIFQSLLNPVGTLEHQSQDPHLQLCLKEWNSLISGAPELIVGEAVTHSGRGQHLRLLWVLQDEMSRLAHTMGTRDLFSVDPKRQMLSIGVAVELSAVIAGLQQLITSVIKSPYQCRELRRSLDLNQLTQAQTQLSFIPPIFLGIQGVSLGIQNFEFNLVKPDIEATLIVSAKRAPMLLQIAKTFVPALSALKLPKVGAQPQLIQGLAIPANFQPAYLQIKEDAVGVALGERGKLTLINSMRNARSGPAPLVHLKYNAQKFRRALKGITPAQLKEKLSATQTRPMEISIEIAPTLKGIVLDGITEFLSP